MEKNLRMNGLLDNVFSYNGTRDEVVGKISRNEIISSGRLCAVEYIGKSLRSARNMEFKSRLDNIGGYAALAKSHMEKKLIFCAAQAYKAVGKPAPAGIGEVVRDRSLAADPIFLRAMSRIDSEVVAPLAYSVLSDIAGPMMNLTTTPPGVTKEITVYSNEAFLFNDTAPGASRSTPKNYLYNDTITINPAPFTANATIKWYQFMAADEGMDAGWYYTAIIKGMWSKIMALFTNALTTAADNTRYVPSYLTFDSYNSANWANATVAAAAANGIPRDQLMAFGAYQALQAVLPSGTASDVALTYNLGPEWMKNGFLSMAGRVPLFEVSQALVPGTVNTTGTMIFPTDQIYIAGRIGDSYAPIYAVMNDDSPVTVEMMPTESADFSLSINVTAWLGVAPVFASKIAVIQNVVLPSGD